VIGLRQEFHYAFNSGHTTSVLGGLLTSGDEFSRYNYTSLDNKDYGIHYGNTFGYLYEEVGNEWGLVSFGMKHRIHGNWGEFWAAGSCHLTYRTPSGEEGDSPYAGTLLSSGLKLQNLMGENTMLELQASVFLPGTFSSIGGNQQRNPGIQIIVKFMHILF